MGMSVAVSGPWDGSAFQNERKDLNNIMSEYKYEYPIKMLRKTGTIKPTSSQDWASMNLSNDGLTMYSEDYKRPNGVAKSKSFKPIAKVNLNSAKMDSVSDYRHAYRGEQSNGRNRSDHDRRIVTWAAVATFAATPKLRDPIAILMRTNAKVRA